MALQHYMRVLFLNYGYLFNNKIFSIATSMGHTETADILMKNGSQIPPVSSFFLKLGIT